MWRRLSGASLFVTSGTAGLKTHIWTRSLPPVQPRVPDGVCSLAPNPLSGKKSTHDLSVAVVVLDSSQSVMQQEHSQ